MTNKTLNFEQSHEAVEALGTLSRLGLINWRDSTPEEDSLDIDRMGSINIISHDGHCLSPYIIVKGFHFTVGKSAVRFAWHGGE